MFNLVKQSAVHFLPPQRWQRFLEIVHTMFGRKMFPMNYVLVNILLPVLEVRKGEARKQPTIDMSAASWIVREY